MKFTNRYDLPMSVVSAVTHDTHVKEGDISVTELSKPPRQRQLQIRHDDKIVEDVSDRLWALYGTLAHGVLERSFSVGHLKEYRVKKEVLGWVVSGTMDDLELTPDGRLSDYKMISVWAYLMGLKQEWVNQTNSYAHMIRLDGLPVKSLRLCLLLRDHSKNEYLMRPKEYPPCPMAVMSVPVMADKIVAAYMENRVRLHQEAEGLSDRDLPDCTSAERWAKPDLWKVYNAASLKNKHPRAVSGGIFEGEERAEIFRQEMTRLEPARIEKAKDKKAKTPRTYAVKKVPGRSTRCEQYCNVKPWCSQWAAMNGEVYDD